MSETIKQAVTRCRGEIYGLMHPDYNDNLGAYRVKLSKPLARRLIDTAPKDEQPTALWEGEDLLLMPNCPDRS